MPDIRFMIQEEQDNVKALYRSLVAAYYEDPTRHEEITVDLNNFLEDYTVRFFIRLSAANGLCFHSMFSFGTSFISFLCNILVCGMGT